MSIIDFHTHILPKVDDGSQSIDMSKKMIEIEMNEGIDTILLTPHFYGDQESMEHFLDKREDAFGKLTSQLTAEHPTIRVGAEVAYFSNIGRAEGMEKVCIEGTRTMLLEMPFQSWGRTEMRNIEELLDRGIQPVLAHVERYYTFQKDKKLFEEILNMPIVIQINAEAFSSFFKRRYVVNLLKKGHDYVIGSDCHNLDRRAPGLKVARKAILKYCGQDVLDEIDNIGAQLIDR